MRNLYASQEATVRTRCGTTDWFQVGEGVRQGCILSPCLCNLYAGYIMPNARLDEAQSKLLGEVSVTSDTQRHHPHGRKWRITKEPLDESERGESKSWLKAQHSENRDHGSCPITSWQIEGETVATVADFIFLGSKITADGDCSHEIKRRLLLGRKVMTNLDSILKSRDIALPKRSI